MAPDGSRVVFVRQLGDRSELATIGLDGRGQADLTRSAPGVQWARPRFSPDGRAIAASRLLPTGELDIVVVDADGANLRALTSDRAKDVEPAWTPDGQHIVFRSDRDGVSNLYAVAIDDGAMVRLTNVVGGAFAPDVSPDGAHGRVLELPRGGLRRPRHAPRPVGGARGRSVRGPVSPVAARRGRVRRSRPPVSAACRALRPRFWTPYFEGGDEIKLGAATGGADPLFRHVYGAALERGFDTGRFGFHGFYQYDRWLPDAARDLRGPERSRPTADAVSRSRELNLRATVPLERTLRRYAVAVRRLAARAATRSRRRPRPSRSTSAGSRPPGR